MTERDLRGIVPILQTPFTQDGSEIIMEDLEKEIESCVLDGCAGATLFGVASEFYKLSDEECIAMVKTAVKAAKGRIPVIASITRDATELACRDAKKYKDLGVDALMMFSPRFMQPSTDQLTEHIVELANTTDLPFMIQYAPHNGGGIMTAASVKEVRKRVKGTLFIKAEPQPAGPFISSLVEADIQPMGILCGNGGRYMLNIIDRGCQGIMPHCTYQKIFVDVFDHYEAGNREKALELFDMLFKLHYLGAAPAGIEFHKEVLRRRGIFTTSACRRPYNPTPAAVMDEYIADWESMREKTDVGCFL